jgi:arsenical pump membrane protein
VWLFTSVAAVAVVFTGLLPWDETSDVTRRMAPILHFLVAITVLAELAEVAMVFDIAAREVAHLARSRTPGLFLLVAVLATVTTILLGLDTTAVLLTPVTLSPAAQQQLSPFAVRHGHRLAGEHRQPVAARVESDQRAGDAATSPDAP